MHALNHLFFVAIVNLAHGEFYWSSAGEIAGKVCVQWYEPADIQGTWDDNYLCSDQDWGIQFNEDGPISGMTCTQILETADPNTWDDNYLCVPNDSPLVFTWSSNGANCNGDGIIQILETADPHTWDDNFLCWSIDTGVTMNNFRLKLNPNVCEHPSTCSWWNNDPDPYLRVWCSNTETFGTTVAWNTRSHTWSQTMVFPDCADTDQFWIDVWEYDSSMPYSIYSDAS